MIRLFILSVKILIFILKFNQKSLKIDVLRSLTGKYNN